MILSLMGNLKAVGAFLLGLLALVGFWKYKNKVDEVDSLKSYSEQKDKEAQALKTTVSVQGVAHKQDLANKDMKISVLKDEQKKEAISLSEVKEIKKTVETAKEGVEFDLKA